jgi:RimJ/RimL family protein N-acetyltransferase
MELSGIIIAARKLHQTYQHQDAFDLLTAHLDPVKYRDFLFENHPIWWSEISAGICTLSRRTSKDLDFIRQLWAKDDFIFSFNRHANPLPIENEKLALILDKEYSSLLSESHAIHWIVKDKEGTPWGLLSLTGVSLLHKRAEVLLGVLDGAPHGLSTAAMLVLFQFYFKAIKFNKLTALIYEDNIHSLKGTLHLGFKKEGHLRRHLIDPRSKQYVDLFQTGLLHTDAFNERNTRLMKRLLT